MERALHVKLPEDRMILQVFPQDFLVDGHPGHRDPRKMVAGQIEANSHLATTITREHEILVAAVNQAHVAVEETVFEAQAACYAAVKSDERSEGFAVLNIGAQSLELVVYYGEAVQLACSLPVSADHFNARRCQRPASQSGRRRRPQTRIRLRARRGHSGDFLDRSAFARGSRDCPPHPESDSGGACRRPVRTGAPRTGGSAWMGP